jgi:hypothetical protein
LIFKFYFKHWCKFHILYHGASEYARLVKDAEINAPSAPSLPEELMSKKKKSFVQTSLPAALLLSSGGF